MLYRDRQCFRCNSKNKVRSKLITIGKYNKNTLAKLYLLCDRAGWRKNFQLTTNECNKKLLRSGILSQFVDGYYCDRCNLGFVPDNLYQKDISQAALEADRETLVL